ncbi:hypothetical protein PM082_016849 [Marasmius tenuissimus]|nr:hypothetical protein PM082_016849 [Marasmius tenuissimus]
MPSFRTLVNLALVAVALTSAMAVPRQLNPTNLAPGLKLELHSNPTIVGVKCAEAMHGRRGEGLNNIRDEAVTRRDLNPTTVGASAKGGLALGQPGQTNTRPNSPAALGTPGCPRVLAVSTRCQVRPSKFGAT